MTNSLPLPSVGQEFGAWRVTKSFVDDPRPGQHCEVQCECGHGPKSIQLAALRSGSTSSCKACAIKRRAKKQRGKAPSNKTHGEASGKRSTEYSSWTMMKNRCFNEKADNFEYYGGRGITFCDRWLNSYENFLADMGRKPAPGLSIERIDTNGNYEPGNSKWATHTRQCNNRRSNAQLIYQGETITLADLARKIGISSGALRARIDRGWTEERWAEPLRARPAT